MKKNRETKIFSSFFPLSIFFSILINGTLFYLFYSLFNVPPLKQMYPYIEVQLKNPISIDPKVFVKDLEPPANLKVTENLNDSLEVLVSKKKQRVKKQQRALILGPTQNVISVNKKSEKLDLTAQAQLLDPSSLIQNVNNGVSQVAELLSKEIDVGSFTALNTDKLTYYSFFERINNQIYLFWYQGIKKIRTNSLKQEISLLPRREAVTQVMVQLNSSGVVQNVFLIKSSGVTQFDEVAALSFWKAKQFKNPPQGLVDEQGNIHLLYQFNIIHSKF